MPIVDSWGFGPLATVIEGIPDEEPWWEQYKEVIVIACIAIIGLSLVMGRK